ncbi:pilus assembly protein [Thiobacillus sp.]
MTTFIPKPMALALAAALGASCYGVASGALLSLSQVPLFVTSGTKANVLLILDNSNSMDEDAAGQAAACIGTLCGSASPLSKSEIARTAAKSIVANYTGKINMGLMAYQQNTSGSDAVRLMQLHNSPYDVSYDPLNYDSSYSGSRNNLTKRYRTPNPTSSGNYIYYNVALPFYAGSNQGNGFCFSQTAVFDNGSETYPGGPWDPYRCYSSKTGTSDILPAADNTSAAAQGYTGNFYNGQLSPTDSDLAQGILDFGRFLTWSYVGPTWFSNSNTGGRGFLHVPIGDLDTAKVTAINTKLGTSQFTTNGPTSPSLPLQNAGLTPIEGTFLTAKDYFAGSLTAPAEGGPQSAPPNSCSKDFVVFLTDGLPSTDKNGNPVSNPTTALAAAAQAASDLYTDEGVKSYIVGFALPYGTAPGSLDTIAAAGGTGTAFDASDPTTLNSAFNSIFTSILGQSGSAAAVAMTSGSVAAGGNIFQGQFNSTDWSGDLIAYNTDPVTGAVTTVAWQAGTVLHGQNYDTGRKIITYKPSTSTGIPFRWPVNPASPTSTELDTSQTTALTSNPSLDASNTSDTGANRLNFLRGQAGINGFRNRLITELGDVVDSAPAYVGEPAFNYPDNLEAASYYAFRAAHASRTPMIYVGANDGMLHAFDASYTWVDNNPAVDSDGDGNPANDHDATVNTATSGKEVLAYVPSKVYKNLAQLTSTNYDNNHRFYVDGSPTVVDTFYSGAWHTTLVASLGAGGQGLFALDVTDPSTFSEANANSIVKWEFTDANDPDLGYVFGQPSIVKLNTGVWAAVFSNGYNNSEADGNASTSGDASLFIVNIATGALIKKIPTNVGSATVPNALATPTLIDADGDGDADYAYAGDLQGNMWKFDLCNLNNQGVCANSMGSWGVSKLFVAQDASGNVQPITSSVEVTRHFSGDGYQLYFGTGKYLENSDITNTSSQTFYSLWDRFSSQFAVSGRADLQPQNVTTTQTSSGKTYRTTSSFAVSWASPAGTGTQRGWYMDLPASGERVVSDPSLYSNRILFTTMIPNTASCPGGGGTGWLMELDAVTGAALSGPTFDINGDGVVDTNDYLGSTPGTYASGVSKSSIPSAVRLQKNPGGPGGGSMDKWNSMSQKNTTTNSSLENELNSLPAIQNRSSWRQIFQ